MAEMTRRLPILAAVTLLLVACSAAEQKRFEYRNSQSIAPLQMPAGLQAPHSDEMLPLPQVNPAAVAVDARPPISLPEELSQDAETPKQTDSGDDSRD